MCFYGIYVCVCPCFPLMFFLTFFFKIVFPFVPILLCLLALFSNERKERYEWAAVEVVRIWEEVRERTL